MDQENRIEEVWIEPKQEVSKENSFNPFDDLDLGLDFNMDFNMDLDIGLGEDFEWLF